MCAKPIRDAFAPYLTPQAPGHEMENARLLPRDLVAPNPWQPRQHADPERLAELAADIAARGILQPLVVRPLAGGTYQVVAGERRYQAAGLARLTDLPCIIREDLTEQEARAIALVENLQREDLDIEDEAHFLRELYDGALSLREIGALIHKSHQYVQRRLRLVADPAALEAYRAGQLTLEDLVSDRRGPVPEVPMADLADAAQEAAAELLQGSEFVTPRYSSDTPPSQNAPFDEARATWQATTFKPYHKLILHVRRTQPAEIPPEERSRLLRVVGDLQDELAALVRALQEAD